MTEKASPKRTYASPLRERQAEATRQFILDGLLEQLAEGGLRDFSIPQVAKRAGVTTRTVYRYFPTREALLQAVDEEMEARVGSLFDVDSMDEIVAAVRPQFEVFAKNATLIHALLQAGVGGEVRARGRRRRAARLHAVLAADLPELSDEELRCATALIHHVFSAGSWDSLQRVWNLSPEEAASTVSWGVETLINDLRQKAASKAGKRRIQRTTAR